MRKMLSIFFLLSSIHTFATTGNAFEGIYRYAAKTGETSANKSHEGTLNLNGSDFTISYITTENGGKAVYDTTFGTWTIDDAVLRRFSAPQIMPYIQENTTHGIRFTFSNRLVFYGVVVYDTKVKAWWLYMQLTNDFFKRVDEQSTNFFARPDIKQ